MDVKRGGGLRGRIKSTSKDLLWVEDQVPLSKIGYIVDLGHEFSYTHKYVLANLILYVDC